ncbi:hypothetical protein EYF80_065385 [Liparis tanakae]|uniref:Uncharacterized protein n=1 Tax=Liparis tanakae TaxID=230148 RepID=A0A4Z2E6U7_9TELE|nr:hypothetical protein EYF80_065385 [Liparis tanakae]
MRVRLCCVSWPVYPQTSSDSDPIIRRALRRLARR